MTMMTIKLSKDEIALLLDGLAALPLGRAYNLFQKLLAEYNQQEQKVKLVEKPQEVAYGGTDG